MPTCNVPNRTIFLHDNLEVLQGINSHCIDLVYLDPPFNKNKKFTAPIGSSAEGAEFSDIFREEDVKGEWLQTIKEDNPQLFTYLNGIKGVGKPYNFAYLAYMAIRLIECQRILKPTGSFYLHCDPTMSHYLKTTLDCIFGEDHFRNEIVWQRHTSVHGSFQHAPKQWGSITDVIVYYANPVASVRPYKQLSEDERLNQFPHTDENGERYYDDSAHLWNSPSMGSRPNQCYQWRGFVNPHPSGWRLTKDRLEEEYLKGNVRIRPDGKLERRKYEREYRGKLVGNLWTDITMALGKERTGYPTQKPLALLERIVNSSSNEGDMVLDPFCGCATTCIAAERLNRKWIGIDVSHRAYDIVRERLDREVAQPNELFGEDVHLITKLSLRLGDAVGELKYIFVISHPNMPGEYKVGIAKNVKARLNAYQTSDPDRAYKLKFIHQTSYYRETERHIHESFPAKHEWVTGDLEEIKAAIRNFSLGNS